SCATVPQPWLGRCWNSPTESRLTETPSCGYFSESGTALLATLCRLLSCSAVATATMAACRGRFRRRVTSTMIAALVVCVRLRPATGTSFGLGDGDADDTGADCGADRACPRDTSFCSLARWASRSAAVRAECAAG